MATATARLTREVQVCLAEPSGFTNYVSAVAEAHFAGDPVIFIGISSNSHHFDNKGFKELPQAEVARGMTKYSIEVNEPGRIAWFFDKAYDIAASQPSGPVQLTIPTNFVFTKQIEAQAPAGTRAFDPTRRKIHRPYPHPDDLAVVESALKGLRIQRSLLDKAFGTAVQRSSWRHLPPLPTSQCSGRLLTPRPLTSPIRWLWDCWITIKIRALALSAVTVMYFNATSLRDVDYYKIMQAAGAHSQLVTDPGAYVAALNKAMAMAEPSFIEIKSLPTPSPITQGLIDMRVRTSIE